MLHIVTRKEDELARLIIDSNASGADCEENDKRSESVPLPNVSVFDLSLPNPDYAQLVRAIFNADSVVVL